MRDDALDQIDISSGHLCHVSARSLECRLTLNNSATLPEQVAPKVGHLVLERVEDQQQAQPQMRQFLRRSAQSRHP